MFDGACSGDGMLPRIEGRMPVTCAGLWAWCFAWYSFRALEHETYFMGVKMHHAIISCSRYISIVRMSESKDPRGPSRGAIANPMSAFLPQCDIQSHSSTIVISKPTVPYAFR